MSCCLGSVPQEVRPGRARVQMTELGESGKINPTPKPCEDSDTAVDVYISPEKLEWLCGTQDLSHVTSLEIWVDTRENTMCNFGAYLPKLVQLKMNNSVLTSVRDLGTTLSHLQVLHMSSCSLQDLDGISILSTLKELYVDFNNISDLSPLGMLENLELLDLEGNNVDDLVQIQYLGLCARLQTLTLELNPLCERPHHTTTQTADYSYRIAVRELIPQLRYLDNSRVEEEGHSYTSTMGQERAVLRDSIRNLNSSLAAPEDEETVDSAGAYSRPNSARRPASSLSCVRPLSSMSSRPLSSSRPMSANRLGVLSPSGSRPGSADSDLSAVDAETSTLTHGAGKILFCGNPVQAIRARREKIRTAPTKSALTPHNLPMHVPEHTYDFEESDVGGHVDVFAELRAWREQHSRRLQSIETEKRPQVLAIQYSDEEERGYDDEEESSGCRRSDSSDEESSEETCGDSLDTISSGSSFQSVSPGLHHRGALSPEVAWLSLSPSLFPSPPLSATAATCNQNPPGIRARRLRLNQTSSEPLHNFSRVGASSDTNLSPEAFQRLARTDVTVLPQPAHKPRPPPTTSLDRGVTDLCAQSGNKHLQTSTKPKVLERLAITRRHTARAALQKHQQHHLLKPCRGSSHPD
ncbi:leucine-rich repeat-containing protein 56 [Notolabrus celidotus]|uniref:leucine-rich repeat-containing protein 56 n=1 Tax=Notolabrus celidotus TaxID=1203425 RepID=UPI00148FF24A|nr:leucine-rich repeat-containing protein 56 [Notolabrus celidotus]